MAWNVELYMYMYNVTVLIPSTDDVWHLKMNAEIRTRLLRCLSSLGLPQQLLRKNICACYISIFAVGFSRHKSSTVYGVCAFFSSSRRLVTAHYSVRVDYFSKTIVKRRRLIEWHDVVGLCDRGHLPARRRTCATRRRWLCTANKPATHWAVSANLPPILDITNSGSSQVASDVARFVVGLCSCEVIPI